MADTPRTSQSTETNSHLIRDPLEYPKSLRWAMVVILTAATVITSIYSTAFEPALPYVMRTFHSDSTSLATFTVSIYVLGYVFGPVLVAPASEVYGRLPVLHTGAALFLLCLLVCSFSNSLGLFIFFRAIMGFAGVTLVLLAPAVVADVIPEENRALALSVTTLGPAVGPTLGPIMGGYIVERLEWRWIFWIGTMLLAISWAPAIVILRETFPPVLQARAAAKTRQPRSASLEVAATPSVQPEKQTVAGAATEAPTSEADLHGEEAPEVILSLRKSWLRPVKMLFGSPILIVIALYTSLLNSYLQIYYATVGTTAQSQYGFTTGQSGLAYLGLTVGLLMAQLVTGKFADQNLRWMERRHGGVKKPEYRLVVLIVGVVSLPAGICMYGWALQANTHWIVPIIGTAIIGIGFLFGYLPCQFYVVDVYTLYAASALGGVTLMRSIITAVLPLAADPIFRGLGYGWGNTLLAAITLLFVPLMVLLFVKGEQIREKTRLKS